VAELAAGQHGVVARRQLLEIGLPSRTIGGWIAALSHWSAGDHLRIIRVDERNIIHVSRPARTGAGPAGIVVHHPCDLVPQDLITHRGIPTTSAARTLRDLPPFLTPRALAIAFEQAEYLQILDRGRLRALCTDGHGHHGVAALRSLLAGPALPLAAVRSRLELLLLRICREHGLPVPAVNVPLLGYEVDFLWERERFVVEADGGRHQGRQRDADNARDLRLGRAGHLVRRYSETDLGNPAAIAAEVTAILSERLQS
jgi:very-short-patch-repair endonuclease